MKDVPAVQTLGTGEPVLTGNVPVGPKRADETCVAQVQSNSEGDGVSTETSRPNSRIRSAEIAKPVAPSAGEIRSASPALLQARSAKREYSAPVGRRVQTLYPLMKPRGKFVRVHPDSEYRQMGVPTYKDPDSDDLYYVSPDLEVPDSYGVQVKLTDLYAALTHDGTHFVWWVNRSDSSWYRSALKAIKICTRSWFKVVSRKGPNIYDLYPPEETIPEPSWSSLPPFEEMLESAFDGMRIESLDHPMLRKARGLLDEE